jgi:hypothetical protein
MLTQKGRAEKHLFLWLKKGKRQKPREKAPRIKEKELLTLDSGCRSRREGEVDDGDDE